MYIMIGDFERLAAETDMESFISKYVRPEEFILQCKACPNYGKLWSCPPYDFDVMGFWKRYKKLKLVAYKIISDDNGEKMRLSMEAARKRLDGELEREETQLPGGLRLAAGCCGLCPSCSRPEGKPCRHPDMMRYSMESLGADVVNSLKELLGLELQWMSKDRIPEYMVLAGGMLTP